MRIVHVKADDHSGVVTLPDDLAEIEREAERHDARLLVVDPVVATLSGTIDSHKDHHIRRALAPLSALAERRNLTVLAVAHLNKGQAKELLERVSGSVGFTNAARSVLAFARDPDDVEGESGYQRVIAHAKSNWGRYAPSLACRIEPRTIAGDDGKVIETSRLVVTGEHDARAGDLIGSSADRSEIEDAVEWLADYLADGEWYPSREVRTGAMAAGITTRTLQRAKTRLGVEDERRGFPAKTDWRLSVAPTPLTRLVARLLGATA